MKTEKLTDNTIAIYGKVVNALKTEVTFSGKSTFPNAVTLFYKFLGKHIKKFISYDLFAAEFNRAFFFKNFLKCLIIIDCCFNKKNISCNAILDVGSGAGPASIAYSECNSILLQCNSSTNVRLLDKSKKQLTIAKSIFADLGIQLGSCINDTFNFDVIDPNEIVVFSYFICEQERSFISKLYKNRSMFKHGFIVIDYQYVIERIKKVFGPAKISQLHILSTQVDIPEELRYMFGEDRVVAHGCFFEG